MQLHFPREQLRKEDKTIKEYQNRKKPSFFVVGPMRKQELKSRKKVHASKKRATRGSSVYRKKEPEFVEYEPEVITIEKVGKTKSNNRKR